MTTQSEKLKPCPWCANEEITFYAVEDMLAADCRVCGAHGPIILDGKAVTKPSLAGEAWNTRPLSMTGEGTRDKIILILDANYHTAISKAQSTADQIIAAIQEQSK